MVTLNSTDELAAATATRSSVAVAPNARKVAVVGPESEILSAVQEQLGTRGCELSRFSDIAAFATSEAARETAVLYVPGHMRFEAALLAAPHLRAVLSPFTGIDGFNLEAATRAKVVIGNAPTPENFESMAEATLMLILACLYDLPGKVARLAGGGDHRGPMTSRMLKGKRVGMIGYGRIARSLSERLKCFGAINLAFSRHRRADPTSEVRMVGLEELLSTSDIVCVMTTLNDESRGLLDARRLALCKRGAIFVNVARGGLVDEEALYALAAQGHFARIALDVFAVEPLPMSSKLRLLPNAILTPHSIGHTAETHQSLIRAGLESILHVLAGEAPLYTCNPEVLPAWRERFGQGQSK
jgi:D-3-phosphoglycerate dehydrogenase / 2-oxoglutarate reductase